MVVLTRGPGCPSRQEPARSQRFGIPADNFSNELARVCDSVGKSPAWRGLGPEQPLRQETLDWIKTDQWRIIYAFHCSGATIGRNGRIHAIRNVCQSSTNDLCSWLGPARSCDANGQKEYAASEPLPSLSAHLSHHVSDDDRRSELCRDSNLKITGIISCSPCGVVLDALPELSESCLLKLRRKPRPAF